MERGPIGQSKHRISQPLESHPKKKKFEENGEETLDPAHHWKSIDFLQLVDQNPFLGCLICLYVPYDPEKLSTTWRFKT